MNQMGEEKEIELALQNIVRLRFFVLLFSLRMTNTQMGHLVKAAINKLQICLILLLATKSESAILTNLCQDNSPIFPF